jgi:hypothetical protein
MNTNYTDSISRAFVDEIDLRPMHETLGELALRVTGAFGGGVAVVALLAAVCHH